MKELTNEQNDDYKRAKKCHICDRKFEEIPPFVRVQYRKNLKKIGILSKMLRSDPENFAIVKALKQEGKISKGLDYYQEENCEKVIDHDHLTGEYRGAAHSICNLQYKVPKFIPIFFHNFSGYDAHFLVKELGIDKGEITLIPNNEEKYISFSKHIPYNSNGDTVELRFLDSYRFLSSSLSNLVKNLERSQFNNLKNWFEKVVPKDKPERETFFDLLKKKLAYPYDYMDSETKYNETQLPPKEKCYDSLHDEDVTDEEYHDAEKIWKYFNIKNMKEFTILYNTSDVLLLADVIENFRETSLNTYELDPAWYYTTPGFAWDRILKIIKQKLELLTDVDMLLMFERGKCGGISQCSNRYSKANNKYMDEKYDTKK